MFEFGPIGYNLVIIAVVNSNQFGAPEASIP